MRQALTTPLSVLALALGLAACSNNPLAPSEARALQRAEALWASKNIHDYTFEMRTGCFCPSEVYEWAVVEVRNDRIVSARTMDGEPLTGYGLASRKTVNELFESIRSEHGDWVADIDFKFDEELGYPLEIVFESKPNIADAGLMYGARNLKQLGPG